ncbi:MAG TPA: ribosome assembly RNA-binding protein YhbY [Thiotrichaceae bacterium]|jgi:RNA-binding protein|nr:ribosome assembly RNA-binding protein YhbY [Thiotrichaceae bacterium]HIM09101.1 ribosome assembly RNA-binding protein YhbY [Gammaproteobacteria bacterium]
MKLNNKQKKFLRQAAHHLKPLVWAGKNGITKSLIAEIEEVLERHELIKIKCALGEREERDAGIEDICKKTDATLVQRIGNIVTLYKKNHEKPVIKLPKD